jgi:hypothetical protein
MAFIDVTPDFVNDVKESQVSEGFSYPFGTYIAKIGRVYGFTNDDSGSKAVRVELELTNNLETGEVFETPIKFNEDLYVVSGKDKGNKTTFTTKQGKEVPLPSWGVLKSIAGSIGIDLTDALKNTTTKQVELFGEVKNVEAMPDFKGSLIVGLTKVYDDYNDDIKSTIKSTLSVDADSKDKDALVEKTKKYNDKFKPKKKKEKKEVSEKSKKDVEAW